jgi:hypothetical protein
MTRNFIINGMVVVLAVAAGLALSRKPFEVYQQQAELKDQQAEELREAEAHRAELLRREARLRSSIGREEQARQRGLVASDEVLAPK